MNNVISWNHCVECRAVDFSALGSRKPLAISGLSRTRDRSESDGEVCLSRALSNITAMKLSNNFYGSSPPVRYVEPSYFVCRVYADSSARRYFTSTAASSDVSDDSYKLMEYWFPERSSRVTDTPAGAARKCRRAPKVVSAVTV